LPRLASTGEASQVAGIIDVYHHIGPMNSDFDVICRKPFGCCECFVGSERSVPGATIVPDLKALLFSGSHNSCDELVPFCVLAHLLIHLAHIHVVLVCHVLF
jgi:hypothetical protein